MPSAHPFRRAALTLTSAAFVCLLCCRFAHAQANYSVTALEDVNYVMTNGAGINNRGEVTGTGDSKVSPSYPIVHMFVWRGGVIRDLGVIALDNPGGTVMGINDLGQVIGQAGGNYQMPTSAYIWTPGGTDGVPTNREMRQLPGLSGSRYALPIAVNNKGRVVGYSYDGTHPYRAVRWDNAAVNDLGFYGSAYGVNDLGQIVGGLDAQAVPPGRWFLWANGKLTHVDATFGVISSWANGINNKGQVVGIYQYFDVARQSERFQAFLYANGKQSDLDATGWLHTEAFAINNRGQVVGAAQPGKPGPSGPPRACLWENSHAVDLNTRLPPGSGWELQYAWDINDLGQITGLGLFHGEQRAFLLTPDNVLTNADIRLLTAGSGGQEQEVDGIVCDNLREMAPGLLDSLTIRLPGAYSDAAVIADVPPGGGKVVAGTGQVTYLPPDEYNDIPQPGNATTDITKPAIHTVTLILRATKNGQEVVMSKDLYLARPPVVLVHGINSGPDAWPAFIAGIQTRLGVRVPFAFVDHSDVMNGNGPVEIAAARLQKAIADPVTGVLSLIRQGFAIPDGAVTGLPGLSVDFTDYVGKRLAVRRADVVAWSYGGVVTRWYLASDGSNPSKASDPVRSWYRRGTQYDYSAAVVPPYSGDIRKVITLGSMWRGVPYVNYANEVAFKQYPASTKVWLGDAPFNLPTPLPQKWTTLGQVIDFLDRTVLPGAPSPILPVRVPSMEVMAVNSPWLCYLIYGNPFYGDPVQKKKIPPLTAKPFNDEVAYGSVAGEDDRFMADLLLVSDTKDPYIAADEGQQPSWFPYLSLEYVKGTSKNLNDGLVPFWSAVIPGSYLSAPSTHGGYVSNTATQNYVVRWLNHAQLPRGKDLAGGKTKGLNTLWNDPASSSVKTSTGNGKWAFDASSMAPYPQSDLYPQIGGIGRLHARAFAKYTSPNDARVQVLVVGPLVRSGGEIQVTVQVKNTGKVMCIGTEIAGATLTVDPAIALPMDKLPYPFTGAARTLLPGAQTPTYVLRFPDSVGPPGASAVLRFSAGSSYFPLAAVTQPDVKVTLP